MEKQSGLLWKDLKATSQHINWTTLSKKGEAIYFSLGVRVELSM